MTNTVDAAPLAGRLTIRLEVLPGKSIAERVQLAADCGFDGIAFPGRLKERFARETIDSLDQLALPIKTVSLGFDGSLCSPQASERHRCRESLLEMFELCKQLGAGSLNMPPILNQDVGHRFPEDAVDEQDALLLDQLPGLADEAACRGLLLLLEPVNRFETDYLRTVEHGFRLCEQIDHPSLGLTVDFFHMQLEELDTGAALTEAMGWIRHVHTAENTRVEPGPGQLDFYPGFRALRAADYAGLVEVECRTLSGPANEVLPASAAYLQQIWQQVAES